MIFRQLYDQSTSTYTYLVGDAESRKALLIDCVFEQHLRDLALVRELGLQLAYTVETHIHADHVTGAWLMREATGSQIGVAASSGATGQDVELRHNDQLTLGDLSFEVRATPGHTDGCLTFVLESQQLAFTGDAILIRGAGRTDFQQGDPARLFQSVREHILSLPKQYTLYPGHDYAGRTKTTVAEERAHNPRLGDHVRELEFVEYMLNLDLPHPKRLADAVPANLHCGKPGNDSVLPRRPDWGPVVRTYAGVWQVEPDWVNEHHSALQLVDVRSEEEIRGGQLGRLQGSLVLPLATLREKVDTLTDERPLIFVCSAGARSAMAAVIAEQAGLTRVANLRGGVFEWQALGFPVEGPGQSVPG